MSHLNRRRTAWAICFLLFTTATLAAPIDPPTLPPDDGPDEPGLTVPPTDPPVASDGTLWTLDPRLQSPEAKQAREAFDAGKINACLAHLETVFDIQPSLPPPQLLLAEVYLSQGKTAQAAQMLEVATWRYKYHPEVFLVCGQLELNQGRLANASVHFEKALALEAPPSWPPGQLARLQLACLDGLATVAERRGDWAGAADVCGKWATMQPGNAALLRRWGKALFMLGSIDEAEDKFHRRLS